MLPINHGQVLALPIVGDGPDIAERIFTARRDRPAGRRKGHCCEERVAASHLRAAGTPYIPLARCQQWSRRLLGHKGRGAYYGIATRGIADNLVALGDPEIAVGGDLQPLDRAFVPDFPVAVSIAEDDAIGCTDDGGVDRAVPVLADEARAGGQTFIERFGCGSFICHN